MQYLFHHTFFFLIKLFTKLVNVRLLLFFLAFFRHFFISKPPYFNPSSLSVARSHSNHISTIQMPSVIKHHELLVLVALGDSSRSVTRFVRHVPLPLEQVVGEVKEGTGHLELARLGSQMKVRVAVL